MNKIKEEIEEIKKSIDLSHPEISSEISLFNQLDNLDEDDLNIHYKLNCFKAFKAHYDNKCFFYNNKFIIKESPSVVYLECVSEETIVNIIYETNNSIEKLVDLFIYIGIDKNGMVTGIQNINEDELLDKIKKEIMCYEGRKEGLLKNIFITKLKLKNENENENENEKENENKKELFLIKIRIAFLNFIPKDIFKKK